MLVNISSDAVYADSPDPLTEESDYGTRHSSWRDASRSRTGISQRDARAVRHAPSKPALRRGRSRTTGTGRTDFGGSQMREKRSSCSAKAKRRRDHVLIDDVAELIARVIERRSVGSLNIATGKVHSFREDRRIGGGHGLRKRSPSKGSPRSGPMPHNGYRPFDSSATRAAFPDFPYTTLPEGVALAQASK